MEVAMPRAQRTVLIRRPVGEVFAFFADPSHDQQWRPHVREIGAPGPLQEGTIVHQVVAGPGGRRIPADLRITGYEPAARYAFDVIAGPVRPQGEFLFTPVAEGTDVSFSLEAELSGPKKWLLGRPVQRSMDSEVAGLDKARQIIESGTTT